MAKNEGVWDQYVGRAKEFIGTGNLDHFENDYKRKISRRLLMAREAALNCDDGWAVLLKGALLSNQPIAWRNLDDFHQWCQIHSDEALQALQSIWTEKNLPVASRIRSFSNQLPQSVIPGQRSRGVRTTVISALLMALDVEQYPPFRITLFNDAYEVTGYDRLQPGADEAELYEHALGFLDRFIEEAQAQGLILKSRLDAQSVVWQLWMFSKTGEWHG